jgi:hypothetical protein
MLYRLRDQDIELALDDSLRDEWLDKPRKPIECLDHFACVAEEMGLSVVIKRKRNPFQMNIALERRIKFSSKYPGYSTTFKASVYGHELYHARQWDHWGTARFRNRYLTRPRFQWAMETQAYAESVRIFVAQGLPDHKITRYILGIPKTLRGYPLARLIRWQDLDNMTVGVLRRAATQAAARLS